MVLCQIPDFLSVSVSLNLAYDENVPVDVKEDLKELVSILFRFIQKESTLKTAF